MNRNKLYSLVSILCVSGTLWLAYQYSQVKVEASMQESVCLIKQVTGIPCPSCGSTRSMLELVEGNFMASLYWNPFGWLVLPVMLLSPVWITIDLTFKRESYWRFYQVAERWFRTKWVAVSAVLLVLANWLWTISKAL